MRNKRYSVLQGVITKSGSGDTNLQCEFNTLKEAYEFFEFIKNDVDGWTSKGMITTQIIDNEVDEFEQIIEHYETPTRKR